MRSNLSDNIATKIQIQELGLASGRQTLTGDVVLGIGGKVVSYFDGGASDRVVTLSAFERDVVIFVINAGLSNAILVQDSGLTAVVTLEPGEATFLFCTGDEWVPFIGRGAGSSVMEVKTETGTTYVLEAADSGKLIRFTNSASITVTAPNDLDVGFNTVLMQHGTGTVTVEAESGAELHGDVPNVATTAFQYGTVGLAVEANPGGAAAEYLIVGRVPDEDELALALQQVAQLTIKEISTTTYTLLSSDVGKVLVCSHASGCSITCPEDLPAGFNCVVGQDSVTQVTFVAGGSTVINNEFGHTKTNDEFSTVGLWVRSNVDDVSAVYWLNGGTGA